MESQSPFKGYQVILDISMNDKADGLAKMDSHMPQENTNTSYDTTKQIAKRNTMEAWH